MKHEDFLYRRYVRCRVSAALTRSTTPFKMTIGQNEVIQIRRISFDLKNVDSYGDGNYTIVAALSSADMNPEVDVSDARNQTDVMNRNDWVITQVFNYSAVVTGGTTDTVTHERTANLQFEKGQIVLPRSPSGVLYTQQDAGGEDWDLGVTIYYQKMKVSTAELIKLLNRHQSIKN